MAKVFLLGYPGVMGGANTEAFHNVKLWRESGHDVSLIPTWGGDEVFEQKLNEVGAETIHVPAAQLAYVKDLPGAIVVSMCNSRLYPVWPKLRDMGCQVAWVNCMTFVASDEERAWTKHGFPAAFVFQSQFQRDELEARYGKIMPEYGPRYEPTMGHHIPGYIDTTEFPFRPTSHERGERFTIGRLARPDEDKWHKEMWRICQSVPYRGVHVKCMGINEATKAKLGEPPQSDHFTTELLAPQSVSPQEFLADCDVLLGLNGGARENWPRVGLEAMSAGVPVVAQNRWGWKEMIEHGATGFLADNNEELVYRLAEMAYHEDRRLRVARAAAKDLSEFQDLNIAAAWNSLFAQLGA
jgi:glycosyltransferase involved in cell wall biosynthesis